MPQIFFSVQRAILKFAGHTGATAVAGRFTPGTFTNQIQAAFKEPRLLVVCDPRTDHQVRKKYSLGTSSSKHDWMIQP